MSDDSLVQCIAEIRQALGDRGKTIIETIPRKGYRLHPTERAHEPLTACRGSFGWQWGSLLSPQRY